MDRDSEEPMLDFDGDAPEGGGVPPLEGIAQHALAWYCKPFSLYMLLQTNAIVGVF